MNPALLDDRVEPSVRDAIGHLLAQAREADFAVARIRLDGLDLTETEIGRVRRCRVLLGRLDADTLVPADRAAARGGRIAVLRAFLHSGRLEVRAAGTANWMPDFSVYRGLRSLAADSIAFVGAHYFGRPYPVIGPAFTCVTTDPDAVQRVAERFDELWDSGYDVAGVVHRALDDLVGRPAGEGVGDDGVGGDAPDRSPDSASDRGLRRQ